MTHNNKIVITIICNDDGIVCFVTEPGKILVIIPQVLYLRNYIVQVNFLNYFNQIQLQGFELRPV